jgi:hypothetical protein
VLVAQRPVLVLTPARSTLPGHSFMRCLQLCRCPAASLKLLQTKGHDKLSVGVTEERYKVPWYEFPMGGQGPGKHREREGRQR